MHPSCPAALQSERLTLSDQPLWPASRHTSPMSQNHLEELLAAALRGLVEYVDAREETFNDDDDVRAIEDVSAVLQQAAAQDSDRLASLLGPKMAFELGLVDG